METSQENSLMFHEEIHKQEIPQGTKLIFKEKIQEGGFDCQDRIGYCITIRRNDGNWTSFVSSEDYDYIKLQKWHSAKNKKGISRYATRHVKKEENIETQKILMHRYIIINRMGITIPKGYDIDHINENGFDNRRCNLRISNRSGNMMNTGLRSTNISNYMGVDYREDRKKYRARIKRNYEETHLGHFDSPEEAAITHDRAAMKLFGPIAKLNFPAEGYRSEYPTKPNLTAQQEENIEKALIKKGLAEEKIEEQIFSIKPGETVCKLFLINDLGVERHTIIDEYSYDYLYDYLWELLFDDFKKPYVARFSKSQNCWIKMRDMIVEQMGWKRGINTDVIYKNKNMLDNRYDNIEIIKLPAAVGKTLSKKSTSGFMGVSQKKGTNKFTVSIRKDGATVWVGTFINKRIAVDAYDETAIRLFGSAATLNLPRSGYNSYYKLGDVIPPLDD